VVPLGASNKVLLEFSLSVEDEDIGEAIHNIKSMGYVPIIAHPERYRYLQWSDFEIIKRMGAMIQINASSIVGYNGSEAEKIALKLVKSGQCDFVASDIHVFRPNHLSQAYRAVEKKFGKTIADQLFANPSVLF